MTNEDILIRLNNLPAIIECGIHSGFPSCCIRFYVAEKMWMLPKKNSNYTNKIRASNISWGYIPCPNCLKSSNVVKVLCCPENSLCGSLNEYPADVPFERTKEAERSLAYQLQGKLDLVQSGFMIMKDGKVPFNGAVSISIEKSLKWMRELIS